ncbi:MAG: hypothetical protein QG604_236 [Candidatus Dependentiae bacterium]|nr:hypothetical protein [Candidatus Dependentiae bacterium]
MNIRFSALAFLFSLLAPALVAQLPAEYNTKQKAILLLNSLDAQVWQSTAPHHQLDPLFTLQPVLDALPGLPSTATLFISHTPHVVTIEKLINPAAFEDTTLQPFIDSAEKIETQEHSAGLHIGQLWAQDNLELTWQWWIGARQRNWWLHGDARKEYLQTLQNYSGSPIRTARDAHAPQEPQHRLTMWHATSTNIGLGDMHLQLRYRLPLGNRFSCAFGAYTTIPIGSLANRQTPQTTEDVIPLDGDNELALRLINRARDIMLCTPLGAAGHFGIGGHIQAQINLSQRWAIRGQFTQIHYRGGLENRFALTPATALNRLEEGMPGTLENISSNELIMQHLKQKLYPTDIKIEVRPGITRINGIALNYANIPFHGSLGYLHTSTDSEYSESAPFATLTRTRNENHQINATAGWRRRQSWGEASSYMTGHYTINGTQKGAWGFGVGATVQA